MLITIDTNFLNADYSDIVSNLAQIYWTKKLPNSILDYSKADDVLVIISNFKNEKICLENDNELSNPLFSSTRLSSDVFYGIISKTFNLTKKLSQIEPLLTYKNVDLLKIGFNLIFSICIESFKIEAYLKCFLEENKSIKRVIVWSNKYLFGLCDKIIKNTNPVIKIEFRKIAVLEFAQTNITKINFFKKKFLDSYQDKNFENPQNYSFSSKNKKILFLSGGGTTHSFLNIAKEIISDAKFNFSIIAQHPEAEKKFYDKNEILFNSYASYSYLLDEKLEYSKLSKLILLNIKEIFKNNELKELKSSELIEHKLCNYSKSYFLENIYFIELALKILDYEKPDLITVCGGNDWRENIIVELAREQGIKTIVIQDGAYDENAIRPIFTDYFAAYGEYYKQMMVKNNFPEENIYTMGQPKWDNIFSDFDSITKEAEEMRDNLKLVKKEYKVITYALDIGDDFISKDEKIIMEKAIISEFQKLENTYLILRPHPKANVEITKNIVKEFNDENIRFCVGRINILALINLTDIWINTSSTTALESVIMGKPVIIIDFFKKQFMKYLEKAGVGFYLYRKEEFEPLVKKLLYDTVSQKEFQEKLPKFTKYMIGETDGRSTERLIGIFQKVLIRN